MAKRCHDLIKFFKTIGNYQELNQGLVTDLISSIRLTNQVYIFVSTQPQISVINFYLKVNTILDDCVIFEYESAIQSCHNNRKSNNTR